MALPPTLTRAGAARAASVSLVAGLGALACALTISLVVGCTVRDDAAEMPAATTPLPSSSTGDAQGPLPFLDGTGFDRPEFLYGSEIGS